MQWSRQYVKLQGQLLGHCIRQNSTFPEHAATKWRTREWVAFNAEFPVRVLQDNQGHIENIPNWWSKHLPITTSLTESACDRDAWKAFVL
eukprot:461197-Amphidinium_carterae.1